MTKKFLLALGTFLFTLLYGFAINTNGQVHRFIVVYLFDGFISGNGQRFMVVSFIITLTCLIVLFVIFRFEDIRGSFIYMYISSLLASWTIPFVHDYTWSGGFLPSPSKAEVSLILIILNLICGPAMFLLLSYFIMKYIKRRRI